MKPIESIKIIQMKLLSGEIEYKEAKKQAKPFINQINKKSTEIAIRLGIQPRLVHFSSLMRNL